MRYFGYGSNLDAGDFARWCRERGHRYEGVRPVRTAWLPDHELVFHYQSRARGGGALSVRPRVGAAVPGVVFEVDSDGWAALDAKEGAPRYYTRRAITAITRSGGIESVVTYVVTAPHVRAVHVPPTPRYAHTVERGLEAHGLPVHPLRAAARSLTAPSWPRALFVYGTLMRGEEREALLGSAARRWDARIEGRLLDLGDYPGLIHDPHRTVRGELVELPEPREVLTRLDEVEDFLGYGDPGSLYRRVVVEVTAPKAPPLLRHAWTYLYVDDPGYPTIESGDWTARRSK